MRHHARWTAPLLLIAAVALAFRLPSLGNRPMHADESVNAKRFWQLWQQGRFQYDPNEHHGPTLSYATLPVLWLTRPRSFAVTTEATYRVVPVVFGTGLILLLALLGDGIGKPAVGWATLLTALSPAMVFYSRYYIHETLLVFFTLATIGCAWRYANRGRLVWCVGAGAGAGLMQATKETSVLAFAAMGLALMATTIHGRVAGDVPAGRLHRIPARHLTAALAAAILVTVVFYSSFFTHARGPIDAVLTYAPWLGRAGGQSPHVHPWYYYLHILGAWHRAHGPWWSEGLILGLAMIGLVVAYWPARREDLLPGASRPLLRWLAAYALILTVVYSMIPYKTPWCLLSFHQALILLAGIGAAGLVRVIPTWPLKGLAVVVLLALSAQLGWQAYRASYELCADPTNPYVYAQTLPDMVRLADDIEQLAQAAPQGHATTIKVIWSDGYYWPLPWYLRKFSTVGYWDQVPDDPAAPIVISSARYDATLTEQLGENCLMTDYYQVRTSVFAQLWVRIDIWQAYLRRTGRL